MDTLYMAKSSLNVALSRMLVALVFLGAAHWASAQAPAVPQAGRVPSPQLMKELEDLKAEASKTNARIAQLEKAISPIAAIKDKLENTALSALDATIKVASLQSQMLGFTIAVFGIALALVGLFGFAGFKYLSDKIYNDVRQKMHLDEEILRHDIQTVALGEMGFVFWKQYERIKNEPSTSADSEERRNLQSALDLSELALAHAEKLEATSTTHEKLDEQEHEDVVHHVITVKANYAYWLAAQDDPDPKNRGKPNPANREQALRLGREACAIALKYMKMDGSKQLDRWPNWAESYCYVLTRYGDADQKQSAKELIAKILADPRVNEDWKKVVRKEYLGDAPKNESPRGQSGATHRENQSDG